MKLGVMQPYFFPYIGYWQLMRHVDVFVLLDTVQHIRRGWISRNRILKPGDGWQYITVPLEKHLQKSKIHDLKTVSCSEWKAKILAQLEHYKKTAPYYRLAVDIVRESLYGENTRRLTCVNYHALKTVATALGIHTKIHLLSESELDYSGINTPGGWSLKIAEQLGASEYINPISGRILYDQEQFSSFNIHLKFLQPKQTDYEQKRPYIPNLSIIDILMFIGVDGARSLLSEYEVLT